MFLRLGQGEGVFKLKAKKVILGSGRLRAGSIIAEEAGFFIAFFSTFYPSQPFVATFDKQQDLVIKRGSRLQALG